MLHYESKTKLETGAVTGAEALLRWSYPERGLLPPAETRLEPRFLELEVTERVLTQDIESTAAVLQAVKSIGVLLAIDDFGTGYSSLNYLWQLPIDALKIDRTFVRDSATDSDDAAIVSTVIELGRSLGQRVIAEGVETPEQLAFFKMRFCEEQGYYFGRPVAGEEFAEVLGVRLRPALASRQLAMISAR